MQNIRVLGLMSGTSMDGLDCGIFEIYLNSDYVFSWECVDFNSISYSENMRHLISMALDGDSDCIRNVDKKMGKEYSSITEKFIRGRKIDIIASHGQTIAHVDGVSTLQIGDVKYLRESNKVPVISNFRQADIKANGNGAPLMPFLDWLLFQKNDNDTITLNLGGVANITYIPKSGIRGEVLGFDTGPGMALIDEACKLYFGERMDTDGIHAKLGKVTDEVLMELSTHKFVQKTPPKSTGRHEFGRGLAERIISKYSEISPEDMIKTFCVFTANSIADNINKYLNFTTSDCHLIISGGGVHHPVLMEEIHNWSILSNITTSNDIGINPDMKESLLMAVLGVAKIANIPANMPSVTGAREMVVLGDIFN